MAQIDVHRNIGRHKNSSPFIVIVQSSQFDNYHRRVAVPLVRASEIGSIRFTAFNPTFLIRGIKVVFHPMEIVSIPVDQLGTQVGSLAESGQELTLALDELLTRAWK